MRVVLDTNVLIAGLLWLGPPHQIFEWVDQGKVTLCTSEALLQELEEVLQRAKFRATLERQQTSVVELMVSVVAAAEIFETSKAEPIIGLRDSDDMLVFECATAAKAEYIISGDKDLLVLEKVESVKIVSPGEFIKQIEEA